MAQAKVEFKCKTCGKYFKKVTVKNNRKEADAWEKWMVDHADQFEECPDCYRERKEQETIDHAEAHGYAELQGSPKQVSWAIKIRKQIIDEITKNVLSRGSESDKEQLEKFVGWLATNYAEARYWIDHRADSFREFMGREVPVWAEITEEGRAYLEQAKRKMEKQK